MLLGLFVEEMPLLFFLQYVTEDYLMKKLPAVMINFEENGIPHTSWMSKWYMTIFLYCFPTKICTRLWDFFLCEGIFGLVKLVVPILKVF